MRRAALIPLLLAVTALVAAVAVAREAPAPHAGHAPRLTASSRAVEPGSSLRLEGRGFPRHARIALLAGPPRGDARRIGGAHTGRRGRFVATIRIRAHADAARFVARACLDRCRVEASARFRIVAP
jgi:hypothetical protein